jgi:hypothetical protein
MRGRSFGAPVTARLRLEFARLAAAIARFEPPYEYMKTVKGGFSPERRFVLDQILAGDTEAAALRDYEIAWHLRTPGLAVPEEDPWVRYFRARSDRLKDYRRQEYSWLEVDPEDLAPERFAREPLIDEMIEQTISEYLGEFGFRIAKVSRSRWTAISALEGIPLTLGFDKGTQRTSLIGFLEVRPANFSLDLAYPFYFSSTYFPYWKSSRVLDQLQHFFAEYVKIFPDVLVALQRGMRAETGS